MFHPRLDLRQHLGRIFALAHHDDARDHIILVVLPDNALARNRADTHLRNIAHQHRRAVAFGHHDHADIVRAGEQPDAADQHLLAPVFDVTTTGVGVAALQGAIQLLQADLEIFHAPEIGINLVLFHQPAKAHHIGHAGDEFQLPQHRPVLYGAQLARLEVRPLQAVTVNLADRRGQRRKFGLHARGQVGAAQSLGDLLARKIRIGLVVECDDDEGQAELGVRKHAHRIGYAGQLDFNRNGDLLFHLLGGTPRVERDDVHLGVGNIRKRLDRQGVERKNAGADEQQRPEQHEQRLVQRIRDDSLYHRFKDPARKR